MKIRSAEFVKGSTTVSHCPEPLLPEFAFIGRSNVGKSSLINMLTNRKGLAKVSQTPGKTRQINHFRLNDDWFIADLPGYGFAKVPKSERAGIDRMIRDYLLKRENLRVTFLLIDSRHAPQKADLEFMQWMYKQEVPFIILFTKTDKLSHSQAQAARKKYRDALSEFIADVPEFIPTSVITSAGKDEILDVIEEIIKEMNT
jgi:GTP-binding protein